jgi:hypothetical protein
VSVAVSSGSLIVLGRKQFCVLRVGHAKSKQFTLSRGSVYPGMVGSPLMT